MTKELHDLLSQDVLTDNPDYAYRVERIRQIVNATTFATEVLERNARDIYATEDVEIDPSPPTSESENGTWVQGWLWVANEERS